MTHLKDEILYFLKQKIFIIPILITAVCSYGFEITHQTIGIDDTMVEGYLEGRIEIAQGRWMNYLADRIFRFGTFTPYMLEVVGILLLGLSMVLFCVLIRRISGDKVGIWSYTVFGCVFLSFPTISDLYIYYYHSGEDMGYVFTALGLLLFYDGLILEGKFWNKKRVGLFAGSGILLWMAVGCYEAFIVLYIVAAIMIIFAQGLLETRKITFIYIFKTMLLTGVIVLFCIVLRTLTNELLRALYQVQDIQTFTDSRDVMTFAELLGAANPWLELFMLVKRYWLVYFINGVVYFPVRLYVFAVAGYFILSTVLCVKQKNGWYYLLLFGMLFVPFLLTLMQMQPPLYRTCQYLPMYVGVAALLVMELLAGRMKNCAQKWGSVCAYVVYFLLFLQIFQQSFFMNKSFYMDYLKYEYQKDLLISVATDVYREYGKNAKVVLAGEFEIPFELVSDCYAAYDSKEFQKISKLTDWLDPHLKEKYYTPRGYYFGGEAKYSLIDWGFTAYDHPGEELVHFLNMHGYSLNAATDKETVEWAQNYLEEHEKPHWPENGYIFEEGEYIIINL